MHKSLRLLALLAVFHAPAYAGVAVIGNPGADALTKEQVADIFLGKNLQAAPIDLPDADPARAEFYAKATGREPAQVKATWSRIAFSGKGQPPKEVATAAEVKKAVAADRKAIGYIDKAAVDGSVKVLLMLD